MDDMTEDCIKKVVELAAPVSRVWRALTDYREFGQWFRVSLDGPFEPGAVSTGKMTYPGHEGHPWRAVVERMEPERLFSFRWNVSDARSDTPAAEPATTHVEFHLEPSPGGTRLTIMESGFSAIPENRRIEIMRGNKDGWEIQSVNVAAHVAANS